MLLMLQIYFLVYFTLASVKKLLISLKYIHWGQLVWGWLSAKVK